MIVEITGRVWWELRVDANYARIRLQISQKKQPKKVVDLVEPCRVLGLIGARIGSVGLGPKNRVGLTFVKQT